MYEQSIYQLLLILLIPLLLLFRFRSPLFSPNTYADVLERYIGDVRGNSVFSVSFRFPRQGGAAIMRSRIEESYLMKNYREWEA